MLKMQLFVKHLNMYTHIVLICVAFLIGVSCSKEETIIDDRSTPYSDWEHTEDIYVASYGQLKFQHQSAAVFGDYAFFIASGRGRICLYNLSKKKALYVLEMKSENASIYHCNQSCFGVDKYESTDVFPLLYVSQRAKSQARCFVEVFRIIPFWDQSISDFSSFRMELVQTILFPVMSYENSLGNVNCSIDTTRKLLFTYSRNNNSIEDNYGICKVSQFNIPSIAETVVTLNDKDIKHSFMLDCNAINMQGGCIRDDLLYIGQGYNAVGYIYINVIDLIKQKLVRRFDLRQYGIYWEPEGCFFYSGEVFLSHSEGISRILKR